MEKTSICTHSSRKVWFATVLEERGTSIQEIFLESNANLSINIKDKARPISPKKTN